MHEHNIHGQHTHQPAAPHAAHRQPPATAGRLIRRAWLYDPLVRLMALGWQRELREKPLDLIGLRPGERVLDIGCGTGDLTLAAAKRVGPNGAVYGIDASPEMIAVARRKAARNKRPANFQLEAVEALSFAADSFDVVLSSLMMHHLPGDLRRRALAEVSRVLRPGGRIIVVDWDWRPGSPTPRLWQPGGLAAHRHSQAAPANLPPNALTGMAAVGALLREAGFTDIKTGSLRYEWLGYAQARLPN